MVRALNTAGQDHGSRHLPAGGRIAWGRLRALPLTLFAALLFLLPTLPPGQGMADAQSLSAPPNVVAVHSRKAQGPAGTFSLNLALTPQNPTTEPRAIGTGGDHALVFVFDKPVSNGAAMVTEGAAVAGAPAFAGNEMRVPLSAVANRQYVTLAVTNVTATDGGVGGGSVRLGFLVGDVNGSRNVTLSDQMLVNGALSQPVTAQNVLLDVNVSGTISLADKITVQNNLTLALPDPGAAPPTVSITSPASGTGFTAPQTVTITASAFDNAGVTKVEFYKGAALMGTDTSPPYAHSWPVTGSDNGTHSWTARAYGPTASAVSSPTTLYVDIPTADGAAPTVAIAVPTSAATWNTTNAALTLAGMASDNVGVTGVSWANAANGTSGSMSGTTVWSGSVGLAPGSNVITVTARDAANNTSSAVLTVTYAPNLPPTPGPVTTASVHFGGFTSTPFNLYATFGSSTALTGCEYSTNGGSNWAPAVVSGSIPNFTCTKSGIAGANGQAMSLTLRATNAGGTGTATAVARTIDAAAPVTGSNAPAAWVATDQSVALTASDTAGAGVAGTQYCTDAANACTPATAGTSVAVTCASGAACLTYVRFRSMDNVGNVEATKSALVRIDRAAPTNGSLTATPGNTQVVLNWSGISDTGSGLAAAAPYKLVFATGGVPASCNAGTVLLSGTGTGFTHTGLANGTAHHYRLCATDAGGNVSAGATASATPQEANRPPVANAGPDIGTTVGATITLNGSGSSDPDGTIVNYQWNFGDGTSLGTGSVPSANHSYATAGTYNVTLTVTDNSGAQAGDTAVVTVTTGTAANGAFRSVAGFGADGSITANYGTAVDASGNVIIAGAFWGAVDFGGGTLTSRGSSDIFVAKYSSTGQHLWSKRFGDALDDVASAVRIDASGNVIVAGAFKGTADFGGGPVTAYYNGVPPWTSDAFVAKFDANGNHLWVQRFGSSAEDAANAVAVDAAGNVAVTGSFSGRALFGTAMLSSYNGSPDMFLVKLLPTGQLAWPAKRFGNSGIDSGNGIAFDAGGNILLTGAFMGPTDFGGGNLAGLGGGDIVLVKFSSAGAHVWSKQIGGTADDVAFAVATDAAGNAVVTGYVQGAVNFGGGATASAGSLDSFVAKYASDGSHQWSRRLGGANAEQGLGIATNGNGDVLVVGAFQGTVDFGTGPLASAGSWDVFVAKYTAGGTPLWSKRYGSSGDDYGYAAAFDASGSVTVTGTFHDTVDFGGGVSLTSAGWTDAFVLNLAP